jgi:trehalose 6-phosphate synthase
LFRSGLSSGHEADVTEPGGSKSGRVIVVSNRVGLPSGDGKARAGGLEVVMRSFIKRNRGVWFGWSGQIAQRGEENVRTVERGGVTYITTDLNRNDYQEYYNGFANRMLWPILHYRLDLVEFSNRDMSGYLRVNEKFADILSRFIQPDDVIWVQDYHLMPLAKALRERGHNNRIGFFLHIPFPPPELLATLPKHEQSIYPLCHYDLVGFQTEGDADNFARYLTQQFGMKSRDGRTFHAGGRTVRLGAFPVGVETAEFERLARRSVRVGQVAEVLTSISGRMMIIGVDRLDYSKGLDLRMRAFEHFLGTDQRWRNAVTYLQITPRSRSEIKEYADMERRVRETVGRVNGHYGEAAWTPIRYVNRTYSRTMLAGFYRSSRACLVTPLRDGMNLVAKEYVAAQDPEDPGVLVLSQFAGAAVECKSALLINPYDQEAVAAAIGQALSMPLDERKARHAELIKVLSANDIKYWGERFLAALLRPQAGLRLIQQAGA